MHNRIYVYLAGPITGLTESSAKDWRESVKQLLPSGFVGVDPLRSEPKVNGSYKPHYADKKFGTPSAINVKNWVDTMRADVVLAYLPRVLNEKELSIGTMFEIGWASAHRKHVVLVTDDPRVINHPLMTQNVSHILPSFEDAVDTIAGIYSVYTQQEHGTE